MRQPPTGTVTFLFTDVEASTRLWEQAPDTMRLALARHEVILQQAIAEHGGYVFKSLGDAFCASFATAPQAVEAARAAQCAMAQEPWPETTVLRVRIALHTGTAEERGGDYFGPALNRVARLMAAGHGGQILLSGATQELTRDTLPPAVSLLALGDHRLKDLGRPEMVFQLLHPSLPAVFPPLRTLDNPDLPNNLPQQATSFIGREKEVAAVKTLLGKTRLLTLTGAGGSGKSRLSLQAAADLLTGEGDGVWLVELAPLADPALIPQAVADALSVREEAGKPLSKTLVEWLKPKRLLLILDNAEHVLSACATLCADLLRNCPQAHILVTSREPLNVAGEQVYRVPTLSLPDPKKPQTEASLSQYEAVRLFIERAQAVQPGFAVSDANAPAVAQICFNLDGIPLAIELAAARARSLSAGEINARLDNRFRLLTGGSKTALPHQQTLRALIDWSYDLLNEREKAILCRLCVFTGGWTLQAAEAVCACGDVEDFEVLDLLTSLTDKSLVVAESQEEQTRYRLLETVRQYGADRLAEGEQAADAQGRHAAWFSAFAERAVPLLRGPEGEKWLARLEMEYDNLRAALTWYEQQPEETTVGLKLADTLFRFWERRGYWSEGRQWLNRALARGAGGEAQEAEAANVRAQALTSAGVMATIQGDYPAARALFEEGLTLHRQRANTAGIARSLLCLGSLTYEQGDYPVARGLYEESLALAQQLGDERGIATSLANLGNVAFTQGDYALAHTQLNESLAVFRRLSDTTRIAHLLVLLGSLAYGQGDYDAARGLYEESLALGRQMGDQRGIATSIRNLGSVASVQGDYAGARGLYEESVMLLRQMGDQRGVSHSLRSLGSVAALQGDYVTAWGWVKESLMLGRQLGNQPEIADGLEATAEIAQGQDQAQRAVQLLGAADALRGQSNAPLSPSDRQRVDKHLSAAHALLGDAFSTAWDAGRKMTLEQAVDYALADAE